MFLLLFGQYMSVVYFIWSYWNIFLLQFLNLISDLILYRITFIWYSINFHLFGNYMHSSLKHEVVISETIECLSIAEQVEVVVKNDCSLLIFSATFSMNF